MSIFENLEQLNVSEKCFNDIMMIIEGVLNEEDLDKEAEEVEKKLADSIQRIKDKKIGLDLKRRKLQINREKLENIFGNKEATEQAASDHADAQIKKGLSESCFNEITSIIEEIIAETAETVYKNIEDKYGKPEYDEEGNPTNKSAELTRKFTGARSKEFVDAYMRDYEKGKDLPRGTAGRKECTTHAKDSLYRKRNKTNSSQNSWHNTPKSSPETREAMKNKHAELSGGKKGMGGMKYNDFIEQLRKIKSTADKSHQTKGGKHWK